MIENILIVDDEPFQRKGLKNMILSRRPETHIETARNGRLALDMIQKNPPDLVMTDIRMPSMDGLELAEQIRNNFSTVHVVLVSAFQEFTYAKQAIQFGVVDYLLKPYLPQDIEAILERLDRASAETRLSEREVYRKDLSRLLDGSLTEAEKESFLQKWGLSSPKKGCVVSCGFCSPQAEEPLGETEIGELIPKIRGRLAKEGKDFYTVGGVHGPEGLYFILPGLTDRDALPLMSGLQSELLSRFGLCVNMGISDCPEDLFRNAQEAAQHASEACSYQFYEPSGCLTLYRDVADALSRPLPPMSEWEQDLIASVGNRDLDAIHRSFLQIRERLMKKPYYHPGIVKHRLLTDTFAVLNRYESQMYASEVGNLQNKAYTEFFNARSLELLICSCDRILCAVAEQLGPNGGKDHDRMVQQCLKWIGENIGREISLMDAAEHFHFNGSYFSSLIKQKTGMSYGQYILSLRMREACRLLRQTDEKVQTVALRVGYRDPCYFNRVFKRENGVTPDQYRRRSVG